MQKILIILFAMLFVVSGCSDSNNEVFENALEKGRNYIEEGNTYFPTGKEVTRGYQRWILTNIESES